MYRILAICPLYSYTWTMNRTNRYQATGLHHTITRQGRKQRWLASVLGISESAMSKIVHGTRTVDRARGEAIAAYLDTPFDSIFVSCS